MPDDAIVTERNSAVAEAKLWLHRYTREANRVSALRREVAEYAKALKECQDAYDALLFEFRRLEWKYGGAVLDLEQARDSERHFMAATKLLLARSIESAPL